MISDAKSNAVNKVLHLSVDYPSVNLKENTPAVRNFVKENTSLGYIVFALTRSSNPFRCNKINGDGFGDEHVISMRYWGLPFGIFLFFSMFLVAFRVGVELKRKNISIVHIHAHKLTFEGIAGWILSKWLRVPFSVSVRGEAESKILKFKPSYKIFFIKLLNDCANVFYVSAWFKPILNSKFNIDEEKQYLLPNFVSEKDLRFSKTFTKNHFVTVMDLNVYEKKGLDKLLPAFKAIAVKYPDAKLDIIGRSEPDIRLKITSLIEKENLSGFVNLIGPIPNRELLNSLCNYAAMVLPSHNETFGMIYVESILCGVPILHSKGTGIDGFVDDVVARVAVDPTSIEEIKNGMEQLLLHQDEYRRFLIKNNRTILEKFEKHNFISKYTELIEKKAGAK